MADLLKLDWHGRSIKRRAADDWFDLTDIVQASNAHTGNRARLTKWLGNEDTQRFLRSLSKDTGIPVSLNDARESPALVEQRGKGAHVWGHKLVALRLCAWLDEALEVQVYRWSERSTTAFESIVLDHKPSRHVRPQLFMYAMFSHATSMFKVGISANPAKRLKSLQTCHPGPLELVTSWPAMDGYLTEAWIHLQLAAHHVHGEWFSASAGWALADVLEQSNDVPLLDQST